LAKPYSSDKFGTQLEEQLKEYITQHFEFKSENLEFWVPKLWKEYEVHFQGKKETVKSLLKYLPETTQNRIKNYIDAVDIKFKENSSSKVRYF